MALLHTVLASTLAVAAAGPAPAPTFVSPVVQAQAQAILGERRFAASDGAELYVKVAGQGRPCIFVHGGPGQGTASFEQMGGSELEAFLTMIYLDQRGSGRSPDAADYSLDRVVQDIEEARLQLGLDKVCLISHSFGGILAVEYARRYPDNVSEMVLAFSTLQFISDSTDRMWIAMVNEVADSNIVVPEDADRATVRAASEDARTALMRANQGYRFLTRTPESIGRMSQIDASYPRSRGYGRAVLADIGTDTEYYRDYAPVSASLTQPVLVITGREDYAVGPYEYLRFRFPNQTVKVLETGHLGYFEDTANFVAAIRTFMDNRDPAGPEN